MLWDYIKKSELKEMWPNMYFEPTKISLEGIFKCMQLKNMVETFSNCPFQIVLFTPEQLFLSKTDKANCEF